MHGRGPQAPPRRRGRLVAGVAGLAVVVALTAGGLLLRPEPVTVDGRPVTDPGAVLAAAEAQLAGYVRDRHGVRAASTRCWFHLREAGGSDVRDELVCGPVLFVDGDPRRSWLRYPTTATTGADAVRLTVADRPASPDPGRRPAADLLRRPGGGTPPAGAGGLTPPEPVRGEPGLRATGPVPGLVFSPPAGPARLSGPALAVTITGLARPARIGVGDVARRPAEGERFLAVTYRVDAGEGTAPGPPAVAYEVAGAGPLPVDPALLVPGTTVTELLSVPADAGAVDLVVRDAGLEQRLSLLDGAPGPGNVTVLGRVNRRAEPTAGTEVTALAAGPGRAPAPVRFAVAVPSVQLRYFAGPGSGAVPGAPARAFLLVEATMTPVGRPVIAVPPAMLTLTLPDGAVLPAVDLAGDPAVVQPAVEVPGTFTDGVLTIAGAARYPDGGTADLGSTRIEVPVRIPPG